MPIYFRDMLNSWFMIFYWLGAIPLLLFTFTPKSFTSKISCLGIISVLGCLFCLYPSYPSKLIGLSLFSLVHLKYPLITLYLVNFSNNANLDFLILGLTNYGSLALANVCIMVTD